MTGVFVILYSPFFLLKINHNKNNNKALTLYQEAFLDVWGATLQGF